MIGQFKDPVLARMHCALSIKTTTDVLTSGCLINPDGCKTPKKVGNLFIVNKLLISHSI